MILQAPYRSWEEICACLRIAEKKVTLAVVEPAERQDLAFAASRQQEKPDMRADKPVFAGPLGVHLFRTVEPSGVREGIRLPSGGITTGCDVGSFPPFPLQSVSPPLGTTRQGIEVSVRIGDDAPHVLSSQWMLAVAFKVSWLV